GHLMGFLGLLRLFRLVGRLRELGLPVHGDRIGLLRLLGGLRLRRRVLGVGGVVGIQRLTALLHAAGEIHHQLVAVAAAGEVVKAVERLIGREQHIPARKGVGIVGLQVGDIAAV